MTDRMQHAIRPSEGLLKAAKQMFGGIVVQAWISVNILSWDTLGDSESKLDHAESSCCFELSNSNSIAYDGEMIVLEFSNGKQVFFSNSEWGAMGEIKPEEYEVIDAKSN